jgi:hypothetical protein
MNGPLRPRALQTAVIVAGMLLLGPGPGEAQTLYHSPADDGVSGGLPATVPSGGSVTLHLYLGAGSLASTADPCWQGDGDETCGYRMQLLGSGITLQSFTPVPASLLYNLAGNQLDFIGGEYEFGNLGATKLGDLVIDAPAPGGTLDLTFGETVTTQLQNQLAPAPITLVQVPEPGVGLGLLAGSLALLGEGRLRRHSRSPNSLS